MLQLKVRCVVLVPQVLSQLGNQGTQFWGERVRNLCVPEGTQSLAIDLQNHHQVLQNLARRDLGLLQRGEGTGAGGEQKLDAVGGPFYNHCFYKGLIERHGNLGARAQAHGWCEKGKSGNRRRKILLTWP